MKTCFISSPKDVIYISPHYVGKFINIIDDYIKFPLLASLTEKHFTFFSNETQHITSVEQMAVYATFKHNGVIAEHFVGIYLSSKVVGILVSAVNIMISLEEHFQDESIDLARA